MFSHHAAIAQCSQLKTHPTPDHDHQDPQAPRSASARQHLRRRSKQYLGLSAEAVGEVW